MPRHPNFLSDAGTRTIEQMMYHVRTQFLLGTKSCEHIIETPDACGHVIEYAVIPASPPPG